MSKFELTPMQDAVIETITGIFDISKLTVEEAYQVIGDLLSDIMEDHEIGTVSVPITGGANITITRTSEQCED